MTKRWARVFSIWIYWMYRNSTLHLSQARWIFFIGCLAPNTGCHHCPSRNLPWYPLNLQGVTKRKQREIQGNNVPLPALPTNLSLKHDPKKAPLQVIFHCHELQEECQFRKLKSHYVTVMFSIVAWKHKQLLQSIVNRNILPSWNFLKMKKSPGSSISTYTNFWIMYHRNYHFVGVSSAISPWNSPLLHNTLNAHSILTFFIFEVAGWCCSMSAFIKYDMAKVSLVGTSG